MTSTLAVSAALFAAYFALLAWALRPRTRVLRGRWAFFLRAFFPNWKFYHAVGRPPRLHVRARDAAGAWGVWAVVYPRSSRRLAHLAHSPGVNLALWHQNLVDHLASDINDLPEGGDIEACVSYRLVARLARQAVPAGAQAFQFEVRLESPRGQAPACMLRSPVMPA